MNKKKIIQIIIKIKKFNNLLNLNSIKMLCCKISKIKNNFKLMKILQIK